jgi:hypothetical protein
VIYLMEALHWHSIYFGMQLLCCVLYFRLDKYCKKLSCILVSSLAFNVKMIITDLPFNKEVMTDKKLQCLSNDKNILNKKIIKICDRPTAFFILFYFIYLFLKIFLSY